jgi:hypothetical protein
MCILTAGNGIHSAICRVVCSGLAGDQTYLCGLSKLYLKRIHLTGSYRLRRMHFTRRKSIAHFAHCLTHQQGVHHG